MRQGTSCGRGRHGWVVVLMGILSYFYGVYGEEVLGLDPYPGISVEVVGEEGPPVLLIPGLNSTGEVWQETVEQFRGEYQFHVLTLAGFGGTTAVEAPFLETVRDSVFRYIDREELDRPIVVGHSLGGFLAFWLAATSPEELAGIVAVDGVPFLPALLDPEASIESTRAQAEQMRGFLSSMTGEQLAAQAKMADLAQGKDSLELLAAMARESDAGAAGQAVFEMMTTDLRTEVAKIEVPTLLIAAGGNAASAEGLGSLKERYESQIRSIPNHRLLVAEDARHFIMLDNPELFYESLRDFLATLRPLEAPETRP